MIYMIIKVLHRNSIFILLFDQTKIFKNRKEFIIIFKCYSIVLNFLLLIFFNKEVIIFDKKIKL